MGRWNNFSDLMPSDSGVLHTLAGSRIDECIDEAIAIARALRRQVRFEFNGTWMIVNANSLSHIILDEWWAQRRDGLTAQPKKNVGPCAPEEPKTKRTIYW